MAQVKRERSYHIFYQLLSGASSALKMKLHLEEGVPGFQCLKGSNIKDNDDPDFTVQSGSSRIKASWRLVQIK